ncbi:MAG: thioredoxin [Nannocystaceae bacterium]
MADSRITHTSDSNFKADVLDSSIPVLVDFWAVWCGPCKAIAPHLEVLSGELGDRVKVVKLDVDSNPEVSARYGVRSIPTLLLFKGGEVIDKMVGNPGAKSKIEAFLTRHV